MKHLPTRAAVYAGLSLLVLAYSCATTPNFTIPVKAYDGVWYAGGHYRLDVMVEDSEVKLTKAPETFGGARDAFTFGLFGLFGAISSVERLEQKWDSSTRVLTCVVRSGSLGDREQAAKWPKTEYRIQFLSDRRGVMTVDGKRFRMKWIAKR